MRRSAAFNSTSRGVAPGWAIGSSRAAELAAARELLRSERATTDHDRVLDVVAQRVLMDLFSPVAPVAPVAAGGTAAPAAAISGIVVSTRVSGRIAAPSAC